MVCIKLFAVWATEMAWVADAGWNITSDSSVGDDCSNDPSICTACNNAFPASDTRFPFMDYYFLIHGIQWMFGFGGSRGRYRRGSVYCGQPIKLLSGYHGFLSYPYATVLFAHRADSVVPIHLATFVKPDDQQNQSNDAPKNANRPAHSSEPLGSETLSAVVHFCHRYLCQIPLAYSPNTRAHPKAIP